MQEAVLKCPVCDRVDSSSLQRCLFDKFQCFFLSKTSKE